MTEEQKQARMDELKREREAKAAEAAKARAASDPMKDPTNRPVAPAPDAENVYYYGWVGGVTSGGWKLYEQPQTGPADKVESATIRSEGGETQASFSSAVGANNLAMGGSYTPGVGFTNPETAPKGTAVTSPAGISGSSATGLPVGFTAGAFPPGLEKFFGPSTGYKGYRIVDNPDGSKSLQVANESGGYSTFGATFTTDAAGNYIPAPTKVSSSPTGTPVVTSTPTGSPVVTATGSPVVTATPTGMTSSQQDIYSIMLGRLNQYNLGALAPLIRKLAIEGATESTIMLQLSEEPLYKERFKANEVRKQKGLSVLTPSQYLSLEDDYRQVLRAYGLTQFDNDDYVSQFLANDVSVSELSNRVVTAVQRVRNADPAVSNMLKNLYGISENDLVAYVLDPQQQFQKIERQVAASEISVAAARQGFNIGATVAEQLAAQGISQAEAQKGYATIADILPTAEKLSDIYGGQLESYRLAEGEQEVFNQLASAQRKRRALTERELASFSGQAGLGRTSLTQQTGGQF